MVVPLAKTPRVTILLSSKTLKLLSKALKLLYHLYGRGATKMFRNDTQRVKRVKVEIKILYTDHSRKQ